MSIIIADTLSESGHKQFNKKIIEWLLAEHINVSTFFSNEYAQLCNNIKKSYFFSHFLLNKNSMLLYVLMQYIIHFRLMIHCFNGNKKLILTSYEIYSFPIVSHLYILLGIKVFVIEHNTIPDDRSGLLKQLLYKIVNRRVIHICLAEYIAKYINVTYRKKSDFFNHPVLIDELNLNNNDVKSSGGYFFMPSSTVNSNTADEIIDVFKLNPDRKLLMKNIGVRKSDNVIKKSFFDDYLQCMKESVGVILPQGFSYRVSGVFYEALAFVNYIYMTPCIMSCEMKKLYPDRVIIIDSFQSIISYEVCSSKDINFDVYKHNEFSKDCLLRIINE